MIKLLMLVFFLLASQLFARITWIDNKQSYKLSAKTLFLIRKDLNKEEQSQLKITRNNEYSSLKSFNKALADTIGQNNNLIPLLIKKAKLPIVSYGVENRDSLISIFLSNAKHKLDNNIFTKKSWLDLPKLDNNSSLKTTFLNNCIQVFSNKEQLFELCTNPNSDNKSAYLKTDASYILGLGQEFINPGSKKYNRLNSIRNGKNIMSPFNGGYNGNTLFPIAYFDFPKTKNKQAFALILDNRYAQSWDLKQSPFKIDINNGDFKMHVITGKSLADIRKTFMKMAGKPLLPPKSAFGLWLSEYGYDNWEELDDKIASLKKNNFPFSGVVLDLQWFGGISEDENSKMGSLTWDEKNFPNPNEKIKKYKKDGIDMMLIEESYISKGLDEYKVLDEKGYIVKDAEGKSLDITDMPSWWGYGSMLDWSNKKASSFWHDYRRQSLINSGIVGHWTDLGEPEIYNANAKYSKTLSHEMIHNSYNMLWIKSIYDGYVRNKTNKRPYIMSRSGGIGMQKYGAVLWSGDIGSDFDSLSAQMAQQTHMMWSGIDYYSSDVGGFHRHALKSTSQFLSKKELMNNLYTKWFAYSSLFEIPVRAHTENLCNCKETTPDRIGDMKSNLANINLRYELLPYYYSLAYRANLYGEPIFPSLQYYYENDKKVKEIYDTKMIGPFLLSSLVSNEEQKKTSTYLPKGVWFDLRNERRFISKGEYFEKELYINNLFTLPLFVKQGSIIPQNINKENSLKVFGFGESNFNWYDDDGISNNYLKGEYEQINIQNTKQNLILKRLKGDNLTINSINWILPNTGKIKNINSNMGLLKFKQISSSIIITLPKFSKELFIQLNLEEN